MKIVHCKKEPYDVYIGRNAKASGSKWGNPYIIGRDGDRDEVIDKYEKWIRTQPNLIAALPELIGKTLGCWCHPKKCHGEILIKLVEELSK